jgi:hypothetical protein
VRRKLIFAPLTVFGAVGLLVSAFLMLSLHTGMNRGDCGVHPPFAKPLYDTQAVFVAKIVYVPVAWDPSKNYEPWTIGLVQHRYWGLPWWTPRLVVLGHSAPYLRKGGEYFIDADRHGGRISGFFPYLEFRCGSRTRPLSDATLELRLLEERPPKPGARIIGPTIRRFGVGDWRAAPGVTVRIIGPTGTISTITDEHGVYDVIGLPPGHYSVRADPHDDADTFPRENYERREGELKGGDVWGRDVFVR